MQARGPGHDPQKRTGVSCVRGEVSIWFTSDLHFGHKNVLGFCNRPFKTIEEMDEQLIKRFNHSVRKEDTVFILGDLTLGHHQTEAPKIAALNGKKILIQGNHDRFSRSQYIAMGFLEVLQQATIKLSGEVVLLSHFPYQPPLWRRIFQKEDFRYIERRPRRSNRWLLHGHRHSGPQQRHRQKMIDVGVDAWDYRPVHSKFIDSIIQKAKVRP